MSTENKTENLKLPQYKPTDVFDLKEVNDGYKEIDRSYKEINDNYNEAIKTSTVSGAIDNLELIDARGGETKLKDRLNKFDSSLETITNYGISIEEFGAKKTKTDEENKNILNIAIQFIDDNGGGIIIIPPHISYGYNRNITSSYPNLDNCTNNIIINDFSIGRTYSGENQRDGSQFRQWFKTNGDETDGLHDGNGQRIGAKWHPYIMMMNDGVEGVTDNRRVTIFFGNNGEVNWGIGQGNNTKANGTNSELSAFKIVGNKIADGAGLENILAILKTNGFIGWGLQTPLYEYQFNSKRGTHGQYAFTRESTGNIRLLLETLNKKRRIELYDTDGSLKITNNGGTSNVVDIDDVGNGYFKTGVTGNAFTTANRPTNIKQGTMIFDTTLKKPIWFANPSWVDATGTTV